MKLYSYPKSGHSHRARLFLALLDVRYELVTVDLASKAHKAPNFLALNPFGQLPVLDDEGTIVPDSNAILVYLARKFERTDWLPIDAVGAAKVQRWLSVAACEIKTGPCAARLVTVFKAPLRAEEVIAQAHALLKLIDAELAASPFIAAATPTIADIALYTYVAHAPEGNVDLAGYANVRAWLARIEALPGFVPMPKTAVGLAA